MTVKAAAGLDPKVNLPALTLKHSLEFIGLLLLNFQRLFQQRHLKLKALCFQTRRWVKLRQIRGGAVDVHRHVDYRPPFPVSLGRF